jgi:hypothetical protein
MTAKINKIIDFKKGSVNEKLYHTTIKKISLHFSILQKADYTTRKRKRKEKEKI